jgi:hypothetical protein
MEVNSCPSGAMTWVEHARHGSNERRVRRISSGWSALAGGMFILLASTGPTWPLWSRGLPLQVVGATHRSLSTLPPRILTRWPSTPRGASVKPSPLHSFGQVEGSHFPTLTVAVLPALQLASSGFSAWICRLAQYAASLPHAAVRQCVENQAPTGTSSCRSDASRVSLIVEVLDVGAGAPGVQAKHEVGLGHAVPGMQALGLVGVPVPAVVHEPLDLLGILDVDLVDLREVAVDDGAARQLQADRGVVVGAARQVAVAQHALARQAAAVQAVLAERRDRQQAGKWTWSTNALVRSVMKRTWFSRSMLIAPTAPVRSRLIGQVAPPTSHFGCGFWPPKIVWILTISYWKSSASS